MPIEFERIGVVRTPYDGGWAPHQPPERDVEEGRFRVELDDRYAGWLDGLGSFGHVFLITFLHQQGEAPSPKVRPPWAGGREVGLFASRSPSRPSPIGLSVVRLLRVEGTTLHTGPVDLLDGTPVLDIKPYIETLDSKPGTGDGWIETLDGHEHLLQHLRGVLHDHGHGHDHDHDHDAVRHRGHDPSEPTDP